MAAADLDDSIWLERSYSYRQQQQGQSEEVQMERRTARDGRTLFTA
jgi:hypothetical protein